jgi:hypothetical protein
MMVSENETSFRWEEFIAPQTTCNTGRFQENKGDHVRYVEHVDNFEEIFSICMCIVYY